MRTCRLRIPTSAGRTSWRAGSMRSAARGWASWTTEPVATKVTWDAVTGTLGGNDSGQHRFDRDVIAAPGVTHVIVLLGVNDFRNAPSDNLALVVPAEDVIDGYRQ